MEHYCEEDQAIEQVFEEIDEETTENKVIDSSKKLQVKKQEFTETPPPFTEDNLPF